MVVGTLQKGRCRFKTITLRRGQAHGLLSVYLTWYGLPPALLRSATPLINAGGEGVPVSFPGTIQPGDCHTSVRYFPQ